MIVKLIAGTAILLIIVFIIIENKHYDVSEFKIKAKGLPESFDGVKIAHLSDLHLKSGNGYDYKIVSMTHKLSPDYIFLTGDLISRNQTNLTKAKEFIKYLSEIAPVFYVFGNHENDADEEVQKELLELPVAVLNNSHVDIERNGEFITVLGLNIPPVYYLGENLDYKNLPCLDAEDITGFLGVKPEPFAILLSHNPKFFEAYSQWGADVIFSGHVHGGAVRLFGKGLLSPERRLFPKFTDGVYKSDGAQMIVSRGLGKFRLFNHREIVLCTLSAEK